MSMISNVSGGGLTWPTSPTRPPADDPKDQTPTEEASGDGGAAEETAGTGGGATVDETSADPGDGTGTASDGPQAGGPTTVPETYSAPAATVQSVVLAALTPSEPKAAAEPGAKDELARARAAAVAYGESVRIAQIGERLSDTGTNAALSVLRPGAPEAPMAPIATGTAATLNANAGPDARVTPARAA